ncbi:dTDP-glucose 4,6-dehydratase [Cyanidioschyzon merolae strain 10D]|jgi:dTDP-glucose 4,6-dehydratase|uniref:dTDP-glucose 4,6-dehydratase n=1 Tax=Cyanidioschyzon merolae (strain NIES-3377 / 10D) TaxID=280699 RepID=M1URZ4_CYAM1|nr:dTDP-glucose 4,6-dehydratase [Cyanidioschyzon merolae strain 10D]XP_005536685.1 dTDP-glucose 4,6-dehydratase [Cyanidioschyzon merolae strain 10D]XP_005537980.1 dTDP-glucose 4,6-dehydratase [Cyanidioschyzon merolae strain 10D]BAM80401.1 dTDP-glucose 4,6-dehydratase [Cyanidioschyzon merolae strain 10D]BAM80649.1 dTDP-glucose 4,6-dehydratase [Cyanidioschyzon merolae strain 10D]BAM81944.1 dTDP-glucose 4,6-dehydratase [Cyanidioschyzon merolae strain 10D]|eukprot:XP_005535008.1 dTDP-glucose 4,6-dehydratase [Cyanidioschyzon merolae strain 10D]
MSSQSTALSNGAKSVTGGQPDGNSDARVVYGDRLRFVPRNILVTGGAGFIASHVVERLVSRYPHYRVTVLDKLDYCSSLSNLAQVANRPNFKFIRGDIRSHDLVLYVLQEECIDTVLHFAACTHVDNSFTSSILFTENNVLGTHVLLECARQYGKVRRFIHVSTDEVYGGESNMETESSILAPTNPYACSKAAAEFICRGYVKSFGLPVIITRGNNVYGPHQFPDKLIPKSICLLAQRRPCFVHGSGEHARNFLYVEDAASAFDTILHCGETDEVYNVGSEIEKRNIDVVHDIIDLFGLSAEANRHIEFVKDRTLNDMRYRIDSSKLHALGWRPQVSWEEGLRRTKTWYCDPNNLKRWPNYLSGLVPHPSLTEEKH